MIDSSEKRNRQLAFELQNLHVCEKCSNSIKTVKKIIIINSAEVLTEYRHDTSHRKK